MQEEKSGLPGGGGRRGAILVSQAGPATGSASLAALEARLGAQVAHAAAQHEAHQSALLAGLGAPPPSLPTLPLSSGSAPLRSATLAATLAGAGPGAADQMHALEWADQQFKRAGVSSLPPASASSSAAAAAAAGGGVPPIQNLGMQQRLRHVTMLNIVDKLREGQQHIFLEQFNQFPNVESHGADDYRRIWHAFKTKDQETEHIIAKLNGLCENIETLNRHANHSHS